ncbi:MAG: exosome complex RNA-binding protein Rrp4 [Candidatus Thorarchaeota archaeon]
MAVYFQRREIVVPGQLLAEGRYRPSVGAYDEDGKVFASVIGLAEVRGNTIQVVPLQGVYIPREGDLVIATITYVAGNNWKLDIGGPYNASLHANNALRRPYDEDISRYMSIGEVVAAEVIAFDRASGPFLTMKGRGLRKLEEGMILDVSPAKIPRIIGKRGSMINMINDLLKIESMVGQNGKIWIKSIDATLIRLAVKAFRMIEEQSHTSKLTDRVQSMLTEELALLTEDGESDTTDESPPEIEAPEPKEEPVVEDVQETPDTPEVTEEEPKLVTEEEKIEDLPKNEEVTEE